MIDDIDDKNGSSIKDQLHHQNNIMIEHFKKTWQMGIYFFGGNFGGMLEYLSI